MQRPRRRSAIGDVALAAKPDATALADQAFEALVANDYGQCDGLIGVLTMLSSLTFRTLRASDGESISRAKVGPEAEAN